MSRSGINQPAGETSRLPLPVVCSHAINLGVETAKGEGCVGSAKSEAVG